MENRRWTVNQTGIFRNFIQVCGTFPLSGRKEPQDQVGCMTSVMLHPDAIAISKKYNFISRKEKT